MLRDTILWSGAFALGNMGLHLLSASIITIALAAVLNAALIYVACWRWGKIVDHTTYQLAKAKPILDLIEARLTETIAARQEVR